uniref:Autophagy-related protein n=1 Tax=Panagrellus redivivus TaxID=6233 RepID=A0A7E4VMP9_PANRE
MGFIQVITYFVLNFLGFLGFNEIWKRIQKPPPIDYTTIPGLKHADLAETKESISLDPTKPIIDISKHRGCIDSLAALTPTPTSSQLTLLLSDLQTYFGPVASLFLGVRYVVVLSTAVTINQLKVYENDRKKSVFPFAWASVILGDAYFWEFDRKNKGSEKVNRFCNNEHQTSLILNFPKSGNSFFKNTDFEDVKKYPQLTETYNDKLTKVEWLRRNMPCFVYVFEKEVDINGHKIPAFIPVLINLQSLNEEELLFWFKHSGFKEMIV